MTRSRLGLKAWRWVAAWRRHAAPVPPRCAAALAALAALGALSIQASPAFGAQDEFVPAGALALEVAVFREQQILAFDRAGDLRHLDRYLLSTPAARNSAEGKITRTVTDVNLRFTFGLSDSWNLFMQLPYRQLEQDSRLTTTSDDPEVQAEFDALRSQSLSGPGDLRVIGMHRPVFSDRNGFIWGYGFTHPVLDRSDSRPGLLALALRSPDPTLRGFFHYTRYPAVERSRLDLRFEIQTGLPGVVEFAPDRTGVYRSGNGATLELGWFQELGTLGLGVSLEEFLQAQSRLNGAGQSDPHKETVLHFKIGYGNLTELERGPIAQPYQLMLEVDRSLRGFNVPYSDGYTVSLLLFF